MLITNAPSECDTNQSIGYFNIMRKHALEGVKSEPKRARHGDTQEGDNAFERSTEDVNVQLQTHKSNDEHAFPTLHTWF